LTAETVRKKRKGRKRLERFHNQFLEGVCTDGRGCVLLQGPEGLYQEFDARLLAKRVLGEEPEGHPDFLIVDRAAEPRASIGTERVALLSEALLTVPARAAVRCVLILGAEGMTPGAQNKLLKSLEEAEAFFILVCYGEVLGTVRSRCVVASYRPLSRARFFEETGGGEEEYCLSQGCPERALRSDLAETFRSCGKAVREKNPALMFRTLHLAREKDAESFYKKERRWIPALFAYLGGCLEGDAGLSEVAARAAVRCGAPSYAEADFFADLAVLSAEGRILT